MTNWDQVFQEFREESDKGETEDEAVEFLLHDVGSRLEANKEQAILGVKQPTNKTRKRPKEDF